MDTAETQALLVYLGKVAGCTCNKPRPVVVRLSGQEKTYYLAQCWNCDLTTDPCDNEEQAEAAWKELINSNKDP